MHTAVKISLLCLYCWKYSFIELYAMSHTYTNCIPPCCLLHSLQSFGWLKAMFWLLLFFLAEGDADNYLAYYRRATVYLAMGKSKAAIRDLSRVVELKQDFTSVSSTFQRFLRGGWKWLLVFIFLLPFKWESVCLSVLVSGIKPQLYHLGRLNIGWNSSWGDRIFIVLIQQVNLLRLLRGILIP